MRRELLPSKPVGFATSLKEGGFGNAEKFFSSPEAPSPRELAHEVRLKELLPQPLIASGGPSSAQSLEHLNHQHQQNDTHDHDIGLVAVIAVGQSDLAQTAAANDTGHGR